MFYGKNVILRATTGVLHPWSSADTLGRTVCKWESHFHPSRLCYAAELDLELPPCTSWDVGTWCSLRVGQITCFLFLYRKRQYPPLPPPRLRDCCGQERWLFRRLCELAEALLKWIELQAINCYLFNTHNPKTFHLLRASEAMGLIHEEPLWSLYLTLRVVSISNFPLMSEKKEKLLCGPGKCQEDWAWADIFWLDVK